MNKALMPNPYEAWFPNEEFRETTIRNGYRVSSRLEERLLGIAGDKVAPVPEPHLGIILDRGREFPTTRLQKTRGEINGCHRNSALYYARWPGKGQLVVGYYLSGGIWRSHTFLWTGRNIIETVAPGERYYGAVLNPVEAVRFVF